MENLDSEIENIGKRLNSIELRLSRLESGFNISVNKHLSLSEQQQVQTIDPLLNAEDLDSEDKGLESRIGRFGLAWLGNIVLLFGITFLTQYLMNLGHRFFCIILGYVVSASLFFLADYLKKANSYLSFMFKINALILLYYITLRLHFFSASPIMQGKAISVILLVAIVGLLVYMAIQDKSQTFAFLSVVFALTTSVISGTTYFMLILMSITAAGTIYFYYRFKWETLLILTIIFTYITFFFWLFGNPVLGNPMELIKDHQSGIIFLFILGAFYSFTLLLREKDGAIDGFLSVVTIVNGILFTLLLVLVVLGFFSKNYVNLFAIITLCCLIYSTILHSKSDWNFASAYYALYGFMAMSIALYGLYGLPRVYLLLSVQSLVVVSLGLWFRNRLIVVMNSLLFLTILLSYLLTSKSINGVNFSFALISLISARIINWSRLRLQIKTELIRNLYLITGFFMVLLALYKALPKQFITLSWTMAALLYFILSFVLKNVKYRYMALGNMIFAASYLFLVDLAKIELIYRVLALLFLAAISIGISMYYTNRIKKSDT